MSAIESCSFSHAHQAVSFLVRRVGTVGRCRWAGVLDGDGQPCVFNDDRQVRTGARAGVFQGVRQGLLHDAVDRQLYPAVEGVDVTGRTVDDLQAGGTDALAQRVDVRDTGLRAQLGLGGPSASRSTPSTRRSSLRAWRPVSPMRCSASFPRSGATAEA